MSPETLAAVIATAIETATAPLAARLAALEKTAPRDGRDGRDGARGDTGEPGARGETGAVGERGETGAVGERGEIGAPGRDGFDGKDGLGFDDMRLDYDGERTLALTFARGDVCKRFPVTLPLPLYRGRWEAGRAYETGDVVTWGGSSWHANTATRAEPGAAAPASRAWAQMVRKGDTGKPGAKGGSGGV